MHNADLHAGHWQLQRQVQLRAGMTHDTSGSIVGTGMRMQGNALSIGAGTIAVWMVCLVSYLPAAHENSGPVLPLTSFSNVTLE